MRRLVAVGSTLVLSACAYPDFAFDEGAGADASFDAHDDATHDARDETTNLNDSRGLEVSPETGCPVGWMACGSPPTCIDVQNDASHCGSCTASCASGKACSAGKCGCPTGLTDCFGTCTDTTMDPAHCGTCSNACGAGATCAGGTCACPEGATDCAGFCTSLPGDSLNCGSCGHACNWDQACVGGKCVCRPGWVDCGSYCADVDNSPFDCGGCGRRCLKSCSHGTCISTCPTGTLKCAPSPPDGTYGCVPGGGDVVNCGACGTSCDTGTICTAGACHDYFPAVGCTTCPCATCPSGYTCCSSPAGVSGLYCVAGSTCS